ncbi:peptide-methionine (S)-S-oxide reductase [Arcanobacterium pluranimalium]|uniref:peptide-methionine (S)-S-oxide reductase MsrA n=1 Tax=Arcanobacterium pluranimalium TaxID=108028 RepID=UPI00195D0C58|nr:peptide-methionine (S)-S-oxide reductase [Arcanobacterium pluranimalium]
MFIFRPEPTMVSKDEALPGRATPVLTHPQPHLVLGSDLLAEPNSEQSLLYLAAGCYWGVEEIYWKIPGVVSTSVGFMGGYTPNPTYQEVCTGQTGHTETVRVVFNENQVSTAQILKTFFECHDPTTHNRQGNDVGTQYRSAIFMTTPQQRELAQAMLTSYEAVLQEAHGQDAKIVTEILDAQDYPFYLAEDDHQQYLYKNPNGYRCHTKSGMACPLPGSGPLASESQ